MAVTAIEPPRPGTLSDQTLKAMAAYFAEKDHHPSPEMWEALADLVGTMEAMAKGAAAPKFYLSSLDPGVGKSSAIRFFIDTLLSRPWHQDVGVMICLGRLSEVRNVVEELKTEAAVPDNMLCVLTSDATLNALGATPADTAQVLVTTQQRIERRLAGAPFEKASEFYYRGKPRAVRAWDEAFLPGRQITLDNDSVSELLKTFRLGQPVLARQLDKLIDDLKVAEDGSIFTMPDLEGQTGQALNTLLAPFDYDDKLSSSKRQTITNLWSLSGRGVSIRRDPSGSVAVDYDETLPADLAPMLILDASGRVRETYTSMQRDRGNLVRLVHADKCYDKLTVHAWNTGGGKSAFEEDGPQLLDGIAKTIDTKPDEEWLVVHHQKDKRVGDVKVEVEKRLKVTPKGNVKWLHWGQHMATNVHRNVPNVVLAGTLFYRPSGYEATKRLASGRRASDGPVTKAELTATEAGEHAHGILQALCRGAVRKSDGAGCPRADAYIIASAKTGIPAMIPMVFPGCTVVPWQPVPRELRGHVKTAVEAVEAWLLKSIQEPLGKGLRESGYILPFKTLARTLGLTPVNFKNNVRSHPSFVGAISELGVVEWRKPGGAYATAFWRPFEAA